MNITKPMAPGLISLAADVVAAFVAHNALPLAEVPSLVESVHAALTRLSNGEAAPIAPIAANVVPAVPVRKSITPDYLICLEDGRKLKSLKRHLATLGMTPDQYRLKWNLPPSYPMTAPNYSAVRSAMAKTLGLGRKKGESPSASAAAKLRRHAAAMAG
jgi:predicted transcriptional regulator